MATHRRFTIDLLVPTSDDMTDLDVMLQYDKALSAAGFTNFETRDVEDADEYPDVWAHCDECGAELTDGQISRGDDHCTECAPSVEVQ